MGEEEAIASIDRSISNCWTGLFEPKADAARPNGVTIDEAFLQLNRAIEQDATRVPRLSDLRESGSIKADSDAVPDRREQEPQRQAGNVRHLLRPRLQPV